MFKDTEFICVKAILKQYCLVIVFKVEKWMMPEYRIPSFINSNAGINYHFHLFRSNTISNVFPGIRTNFI